MKERNTSDRLKEIMAKNGLRQIDILNKAIPFCKKYNVKLGRNDLSQYISGKVEPSQKKLTVLAEALGVNEAWLMGYDMPITSKLNNFILTPEMNAMFEKVSKSTNVPSKELKEIVFNEKSEPLKQLDYKALTELCENYKKIKDNSLDAYLNNVSLKDIEEKVKKDEKKEIISLIDLNDLLIYIYMDNFELLDSLHKSSIEIGNTLNSIINTIERLDQNELNLLTKTNSEMLNISDLKKDLLSIKKDELYYYIKKYYNKEDILNEIDKRNIFEIKDKNNNPISNKEMRLQIIENHIDSIMKAVEKNN